MIDNFFYSVPLTARVPFTAPYGGAFFALWDTGAVRSVSLQFVAQGQTGQKITGMTSGFQVEANFEQVIFTADADTTVQFFASEKPLKLGTKDGQQVGVKALEPLPVLFGGTVEPVLGDVKVTNTDAQPLPTKIIGTLAVEQNRLTVISNIAPVALAVANATQKISGDATLKRLEIRNAHETAKICIGGAGVTFDNAVIVLLPDDVWVESDAPGADWYAVADTAGAKVAMQGKK